MSFTETTSRSWFSRLKGALVKIVIGLVLVVGCLWLLGWNEGRSVKTYRALVEGAGIVVSVEAGAVDAANEGKLVHVSGPVTPVGVPSDGLFGVEARGGVGLERIVEMYQWVESSRSETRTKLGGGEETVTTYSYSKDWRRNEINSNTFRQSGHDNPKKPVDDADFAVPTAKIGAFSVAGERAAALGRDTPVQLTDAGAARLRSALSLGKPMTLVSGAAVYSADPNNPAVGDIRVRFERSDLQEASFVAAQRGDTLADYRTSNGRTLFLSDAGLASAADMFDAAQSENTIITWLLRVGGLIGIFVGFAAMLSILGVIADVIPFLGSIVRFGTSAIALVLTLLIGPLVIAIAWIAYRPVLAISILAVGILLAGFVLTRRRAKTAPAALGRA
ncbi:TMEM43 family protein [Rhizobium sp. TRM95111]|uniref:TMEM43 family protein n=1 Tax=Rhizobium alarense TaxID=2846851 RepID=UPI001F25824C|nr:TMEM43 family protein [Rhizobium alarense]MCF3638983.1 TMEM43 family protein [Rhizobium alarense]